MLIKKHQDYRKLNKIKMKYLINILIIFLISNIIVFIIINININNNMQIIINEIRKHPDVVNVKSWISDGFIISRYFNIFILFSNGDNLCITDIHFSGKEHLNKKIKINIVNDCFLVFYIKETKENIRLEGLNIWSTVFKVEFRNILDFLKYFDIIKSKTENWIDLKIYKNDNENYNETLNSIIKNNLFSESIFFDGQEIILLKSIRNR